MLISGSLLSLFAYFIFTLTWLTALGICMLILSFILLALGRTIPKLPPEVCGLLLETGIDNMAAILVKDITLVEFTHRVLQLPDLVKLKRDITHLKRTTSEPARQPLLCH